MNTNDTEFETKVTEQVAKTAYFTLTPQGATCKVCKRRFSKYRVGKPMNELMLEHFMQFHSQTKLPSIR